jgi:hypothetical protein
VAIARRLAEKPVGVHRVTMLLAAVVAFGALCLSAGYSFGSSVKPFWVTSAEMLAPLQRGAAVAQEPVPDRRMGGRGLLDAAIDLEALDRLLASLAGPYSHGL